MVSQGGVALALILSGAAQGHILIQGAEIPDLGGLADDHAHAMVDKESPADFGRRVDLDPGLFPGALGNEPGQKFQIVPVKPVCPAMGPHRLKSGIKKKYFQPGACRRIPLHNSVQILLQLLKHNNHLLGYLDAGY